MTATMTLRQVHETLRAAQDRVSNTELPLEVRIRSKETVALCEERIRAEGDYDAWLDSLEDPNAGVAR